MLTGDKVGTAKNIAAACNILPKTADVLEITTETFPVLNELKTAEMMEVQLEIQQAEAEARHDPRVAVARHRAICGEWRLKTPLTAEWAPRTLAEGTAYAVREGNGRAGGSGDPYSAYARWRHTKHRFGVWSAVKGAARRLCARRSEHEAAISFTMQEALDMQTKRLDAKCVHKAR
eukprot:4169909-Pleurochrysis_carterae.AAC.1